MRLAVLSTETSHHAFFCRELSRAHSVELTVVETGRLQAPFPTSHPHESTRDKYERDSWFAGKEMHIKDFTPTLEVDDINDSKVEEQLRVLKPDVIVDFGTRKLKKNIIAVRPEAIVNLHGGAPEHYRGLDSHLWACYHKDFDALVTCLHRLAPTLDTGEIIGMDKIPLARGMLFHQFRRANTELCVRLTMEGLADFQAHGSFKAQPQQGLGRYYSFMPAVLKDLAIRNFERHTANL